MISMYYDPDVKSIHLLSDGYEVDGFGNYMFPLIPPIHWKKLRVFFDIGDYRKWLFRKVLC